MTEPERMFIHIDSFSETMFLLLGGTGVGYSVQKHHVSKLPVIQKPYPKRKRRFLIGDSIEGWADSVKVLMKSYLNGKGSRIEFDYSVTDAGCVVRRVDFDDPAHLPVLHFRVFRLLSKSNGKIAI